jgi:hypothetical protein
MDYGCLVASTTWEIRAQIKLSRTDKATGVESGASCSLTTTCPAVRVYLYDKTDPGNRILSAQVRGYNVTSWDSNNFNAFQGQFTVPAGVTELTSVNVIVRDFNATLDVAVDDFSIQKVSP